IAGRRLCRGHRGMTVRQVAETDRLRRADRLAGGLHFTVPDASIILVRLDMGALDPLNAIGALLHDPAPAYGDFGIALRRERFGLFVHVLQEVEPAHL